MARFLLVAGLIFAGLWVVGGERSFAQAQSQPADQAQSQPEKSAPPTPDAPQPQKKQASKDQRPADPPSSKASSSPDPGSSSSPSPVNGNAFPEEISRRAAHQAQGEHAAPDSSPAKAGSNSTHSSADANPFPEAVSQKAAAASGDSSSSASGNAGEDGKQALPPGVSSSRSSSILGDSNPGSPGSGTADGALQVTNPSRAKEDTQVGNFYLQRYDAKGAYLRYQDAIRFDPTNIDAIFGIAEAARLLGKPSEAEHNYQLYLAIVPSGPKAKRALKALESLSKGQPTHTADSH